MKYDCRSLIENEGYMDYLTGLFNRRGLNELFACLSAEEIIHCIYIDVDNFKTVNDIYGHSTGDELLVYIAELLKRYFSEHIVVRMGGDEFVILCEDEIAEEIIEKKVTELQGAIVGEDFDTSITSLISLSIGITYHQSVGNGMNSILQQCDDAMYYAKNNGKGSFVVYDSIRMLVERQKAMKSHFQEALQNGEFQIQMKPIMNLQTSDLYAAEATMIWDFPGIGFLEENVFIPLLNQFGVIAQLDTYELESVIQCKKNWIGTPFEKLDIYVRVSGKFLMQKNKIEWLICCMRENGIAQNSIKLAVEEKELSYSRAKLISRVGELREQGWDIILNNFGSGSALLLLQEIDFHYVKLDSRLIKQSVNDQKQLHVLRNVVEMLRDLNCCVIGQGIEKAEQVAALTNYGVQCGNGRIYGTAVWQEEFYERYVNSYNKNRMKPVRFSFRENLLDDSGSYEAICGTGNLNYASGFNEREMAVYIKGGMAADEAIRIPKEIMPTNSYTISMWINSYKQKPWTSIFFVAYERGFVSIVPYNGYGESCYRLRDERDPNIWYDIIGRQIQPNQWEHVCVTYDALTGISRFYLDAFFVGARNSVPNMKGVKEVFVSGDYFQENFEGLISGLEIYEYSLTADEVLTLYQQKNT